MVVRAEQAIVFVHLWEGRLAPITHAAYRRHRYIQLSNRPGGGSPTKPRYRFIRACMET